MKSLAMLSGLAAILILGACGSGSETSRHKFTPLSDGPPPARACLAEEGSGRTYCVIVIAAERTRLAGSRVCSPVSSDDLSDTYAVMDWIRSHPEVHDEELGPVIEKVLSEMHPCA